MSQVDSRGFTLIEVLIVVAIFAIGAAIAIPSLRDMGRRSSVKLAARQLKDQMVKARLAAIELNMPVIVVFDPIVGGKSRGYRIVQDANGDCEVDAGEQTTRIDISNADITANNLSPNTAGNPIVQWSPRGLPLQKNGAFAAGTVTFSGASIQQDVILSPAGNIRID